MEFQEEVASLFQEISILLQHYIKSLILEHGIPYNYSMIIRHVVFHPGVTVSEIARGVNQSKSHISVLLDKMVSEGLVYKETNPDDQRVIQIYPTEKSLQTARSISAAYRKFLVKVLTPNDQEDLGRLLPVLREIRSSLQNPDTQMELKSDLHAIFIEKLGIEKFRQMQEERSEEDGTDT